MLPAIICKLCVANVSQEETKASFKKKKVKKNAFETSYDDNLENDPPANGGAKNTRGPQKSKLKAAAKKRVSFN